MKSNVRFLSLLGSGASLYGVSASEDPANAIKKVVTLLEDMKAQVEKEAVADKKAYDAFACWCETAEGEKTQAVEDAKTKIEDLEAFLEEAAATKAQLKTEIGELAQDIAQDQDSLQTANGLREKEHAEFLVDEADSKDALASLGSALATLEKVAMLQRKGHSNSSPEVKPLLLQVRHVVGGVMKRTGQFQDAMQRDLWDVMGSLPESNSFLPRKGSALAQQKLLPWETTEEEDGAAAKPNGAEGAAAGAKSYNSASGQIVGILSEMKSQFVKDLSKTQYTETEALIAHHTMSAAKTAEIASATEQKEEKEAKLADTTKKAADAAEDLEATKESLSADQSILVDLDENCSTQQKEYDARTNNRNDELEALGETLKILTGDAVRDLFAKTISFIQTESVGTGSKGDATLSEAQSTAVDKAMKHIIHTARKHKDWSFAALAIRVRLDPFTKIIATMDKMTAGLKKQQKEEYEKKDWCDQEIDDIEDSLKVKNQKKEDLAETKLDTENSITTGTADIENLKTQISEMQVSLKKAGLERKEQNQLFQSDVADQRATIMILNKALERLSDFYATKSFAQFKAVLDPPPPTPKGYSKSGGGGGVMQLIQKIISDAELAEQTLLADEQSAQNSYSQFAADTTATLAANQNSITEKSVLLEQNAATKSQTNEAISYNDEAIAKLDDSLHAIHTDCDFLLKYFDIRQQARKEEMASIVEAKAILSGAGLSTAMEAADDATA